MPSILYNPQNAATKTNPGIDPKNILEKVEEKPPSKKTLAKGIKEIYGDFCSNTSIHGFQYFGQHRPRKEILFWIVIFVITIYFCTTIIVRIYVKWSETPVIVSFSEKSTPIWSVPFPRVTICPETKRAMNMSTDDTFFQLMEKLDTFLKEGQQHSENFTLADLERTLTLMHICKSGISGIVQITQSLLKDIDYTGNLNHMLPRVDKYLFTCEWFGNMVPCERLFNRVYTDEGICYTFNSLKADDLYREGVLKSKMRSISNETDDKKLPLQWSLEQGYDRGSDLHTYPARVLSSGSKAGLNVHVQSFLDEVDYTCNGPIQGFKILLHSPDDVPSVSKHFVRLAMDKEVMIAVKPKMITTSDDIAAYDPMKRRCFMSKDRQLKFYKIYSQNNCERECLTNFTYAECGCVQFSMPRFKDMPVCGEDKILCYSSAYNKLLVKQFKDGLASEDGLAHLPLDDCNCMPACTSLEYETEISEGHFDLVNTLKAFNNFDDYFRIYPGGKMSLMSIYFKENQFITSRRSELYGVTELLANFGGVFGLFMGISILSIVEMIYHFSLRLWSNMTRSAVG
uniref:Pickpocket protein 28-like n=1 Tax=Stomoxys calcitrans TaxID=35570 RepID=A0A1I8Q523_STOCA